MKYNVMLLLMCLALVAVEAKASEFVIHPSMAVSEEYTDNVFEMGDNKRSDYITRVLPGFALQYKASLWDWDWSYTFDYRYYARQSRSDETTHNLAVKGLMRVVDEFFFLDLNETYKRVSLDVTRDYSSESLFFNQSDQNVFTASPYFVWKLNPKTNLRTGYRYVNTWYKEAVAENKIDHGGFAEVTYELNPKASLNGGYTFTHEDSSITDFNKHDAYAGGRYEFGERSFIFSQVGNTWIRYNVGGQVENLFWNVGVSKSFDTLTATFNTGIKYSEDPLSNLAKETFYTGGVEYGFDRGLAALTLNFSDFDGSGTGLVDTKKYTVGIRGKFELLPDLTGSLVFEADNFVRSFMSNFPRRFYVNGGLSYILSQGLTIGLNHTFVDYFSPTVVTDNRQINRVVLELRKTF